MGMDTLLETTISKHLEEDKYPIPTLEEIYGRDLWTKCYKAWMVQPVSLMATCFFDGNLFL
jgi:hypothetical protein